MKNMKKDLIFYFSLLMVSAGLALWSSFPRSETDLRQIKIVEINPAKISEIQWTTAQTTTTASRRAEDGKFWISSGKDAFLANARLDEALNTLNPFKAQRLVARIDHSVESNLASYGLNPAVASLKITVNERDAAPAEVQIQFGRNSFGTTDRYVLTPDGKSVVLVAGDAISGFDNPVARFFERTVFPAKLDESDSAELTRGDAVKTFRKGQPSSANENSTKPATKAAPQMGDREFEPPFHDWLEKAERLRGIRYADQELEGKLSALAPELLLKFKKGSIVAEEVAIKRLIPASGKDNTTWWVISTSTRAHLEISANRAEPLIKDAEGLF